MTCGCREHHGGPGLLPCLLVMAAEGMPEGGAVSAGADFLLMLLLGRVSVPAVSLESKP